MNKTLLGLTAFFFLLTTFLLGSLRHSERERERLKSNQSVLLADVEKYKTESGKNAAAVRQLEFNVRELEEENGLVASAAEELRIKLGRIQSASAHATQTQVSARTILRDTIIVHDSVFVPAETFVWSDPWTRVEGLVEGKNVDLSVESRDTLVQIVHREPHKFLFFRWGCKAIRQEIVSSNPHTTITYSEYIKVK